jgi:hypothetical protein
VSAEVPDVIQAILRTRHEKMGQAAAALDEKNKYSNLALTEFKRIHSFWATDFLEAWTYESEYLYVKSLNALLPI